MKKLFLILILIPGCLKAEPRLVDSDHDDLVHSSAHFGSSFVLQTVFYGIYQKGFGMPKTTAFIFAAIVTTSLGLSYKYMSGTGKIQGLEKAFLWNSLGILGAGLTISVFEF